MEPIVTFEDFLKTYSERTRERVRLYFRVMRLRKKYGYGSKKIAKIFGIPRSKTEGWLYRGNIPRSVKAFKFLEQMGFNLPFFISKNLNFILFLKLLSFTFGDGGVATNFRPYFTGRKADLNVLKKEIEDTFLCFRCKIVEIKNKNSKINGRVIRGHSFVLNLQSKGSYILGRLLCAAGAPRGDKVVTPFLIPRWIVGEEKWIKTIFLNVLLGNELQAPRIDKARKTCFSSCQFRMVKTEEFLGTQRKFLNQIRGLLGEFGIQTSKIREDKPRRERKDGKISYPLYFRIQKNKLNLYRFYKQFKLLYAKRKQEDFDNTIRIIEKSLSEELIKIRQYAETQRLRRKNLGCRRIARYLYIPEKRSMVDGWIRYGQKPIYFNQKEELEQLLKK